MNDLAEQCPYKTRSGERCRKRVVEGLDGCSTHAGIEDATSPATTALVIDASGKTRQVLLRSEMGQNYLCPDGRILGFVDGELQQVGSAPTTDECDYSIEAIKPRGKPAERPVKVRRKKNSKQSAPKEVSEGAAKVAGMLRVRST